MSRLGKLILAIMFLAGMSAIVQGAEQPRTATTPSLGTFQLDVSQDYLSLDANQASLVAIFEEIGKQAKISFDSNIGPEEKITIHLDQVPLEDGIKQIAKNATFFYTENPKDKTRHVTRVVVLAEGSGVSDQTKAPSQPEKVKESDPQAATIKKPSPQPEPFKFEFDPAKSTEKAKAQKQP